MSDPGSEPNCASWLLRGLETPENRILGTGLDAGQVQNVDDDEEKAEHAPNHDQPPWDLVRASVFLARGPDFGMRVNTEAH